MTEHPIPPIYDEHSKILILGSFPSVKSRKAAFYYAHPQNRFWKVTSAVFGEPIPGSEDEKRDFLLKNHIALWDVIASCDIIGSSDSSIKNVVVNDVRMILDEADIAAIYVNGSTAAKYYRRYILDMTGRDAIYLPSTSPANAAWSTQRLIEAWTVIADHKDV